MDIINETTFKIDTKTASEEDFNMAICYLAKTFFERFPTPDGVVILKKDDQNIQVILDQTMMDFTQIPK